MPFTRSPSKYLRSNMDRIRRSLRDSFRKRSSSGSPTERQASGGGGNGNGADSLKPQLWSQDEASVRAGTCTFSVKYLGSAEVSESRGMQVCEEALKLLRTNRRRPTKGILYVTGDGLRVVDSENKGLVVDQTIEKVSFCAPDRNHEKGFAYICRDGTTRRWMCHGFHASKDSGERLSHAVGCAFAVCLERKQKRDRDAQQVSSAQVSQTNSNNTTPLHSSASALASTATQPDKNLAPFQRQSSFKQAPLNERLQDPQNVKPAEKPPVRPAVNPHAVARPLGNRNLFERQGSLRMPSVPLKETSNVNNGATTGGNQDMFRRFNSLRLNQLPSNLARYEQTATAYGQGAILEEDTPHPLDGSANNYSAALNFYGAQSNSSYFSPPVSELGSPLSQTRSASFDAPLTNGQGAHIGPNSREYISGRGAPIDHPNSSPAYSTTGSLTRLRGDEWLQTAAKQAKLLQHYRSSPTSTDQQTVQEAIPRASQTVAPPPLPPRQPQPPIPIHSKTMFQQHHARSFDFGPSSIIDSSTKRFPVDFRSLEQQPVMEFDAKWNALTAQQQRRHSEVLAGQHTEAILPSTNPFSQESSSVNI